MNKNRLYQSIFEQTTELFEKCSNIEARMCTIAAILHHKMNSFFWTGFYMLSDNQLIVKTYQGPLACMILEKDKGVCWSSINQQKTIIVPDVHQFQGHIACDSRSNSEIVVPVFDYDNKLIGVLDIDSTNYNNFDEIDAKWLEKIVKLLLK